MERESIIIYTLCYDVIDHLEHPYRLEKILALCKEAYVPPNLDEEDKTVIEA